MTNPTAPVIAPGAAPVPGPGILDIAPYVGGESKAEGVEQQGAAENVLTAALGRLLAVAEAYPALRATENFQALQTQLADIEGSIAIARQVYNDTVLTYMNAIQTVPSNLVAGPFGFHARAYFEIEEVAREPVQVRL